MLCLGKRERAQLRSDRANEELATPKVRVARRRVAAKMRSAWDNPMPRGNKMSRTWGWNGQVNRRVRREARKSLA